MGDSATIFPNRDRRGTGHLDSLKLPASAWWRKHSPDLSTPPQVASSFGVGRHDKGSGRLGLDEWGPKIKRSVGCKGE